MPLEYSKIKTPVHMRWPSSNLLDSPHYFRDAVWTPTRSKQPPYHCERCYGPPVVTINGKPVKKR